eukprot:470578_1
MMNKKIPIRIPSNSTLQIIQRWNKCTNSYTNMEYVKSFKCLDISQMDESMICSAFNNYENISEPKNYFSINKLLKICSSNPMASRKIFILWKDIINTNNIQNIYHGLLLKSCCNILKQKHLSTMEINKCIEILKCILSHNQLTDTIYVYCALINAFGQQKKINDAVKIFNQLPNDKITVNTINAMMTAYINNKQYHSAVSLYKQYHSSHNQITHPVKILTKLIDFYGESKDINSSENVFKLIPKQKRTVSCITALLKVYSNNMYFDKVILLYKEYYSMHTEIMDNLVLKACQKVYNYKF